MSHMKIHAILYTFIEILNIYNFYEASYETYFEFHIVLLDITWYNDCLHYSKRHSV